MIEWVSVSVSKVYLVADMLMHCSPVAVGSSSAPKWSPTGCVQIPSLPYFPTTHAGQPCGSSVFSMFSRLSRWKRLWSGSWRFPLRE